MFVANGPDRIGSTYRKSLYREYTDATFTTPEAARRPSDAYLGFLGPVIRAQVGDTLKVVFRNNTPFPASMHPHNVFYDKKSEGAPYADGTGPASKGDDAVAPGATYTYTWKVPERAGPGPGDGSSVLWMYHSHTDEVGDTYARPDRPDGDHARRHGDAPTARRPTSTARSSPVQGRGREPEPVPRARTSASSPATRRASTRTTRSSASRT